MLDGTVYLDDRQYSGERVVLIFGHARWPHQHDSDLPGSWLILMEAGAFGMALALSLGGSLHCIGMCGGFAVMANAGAKRVGLNARFAAYAVGKTLAYVVLGAIIGVIGAQIGAVREGASVLAWLAGIAMIMVGGHLLGWPGLSKLHPPAASSGFVSRFASLLKQDSVSSRLAIGVLNGWLPCGLVYAAMAMALSTGSMAGAASFMAIFGLGTIPSLWVAAQLSAVIPPAWRARLSAVSGWLVVLFGLYTIIRGTGLMAIVTGGGHAM